jgi:hypothetical protein
MSVTGTLSGFDFTGDSLFVEMTTYASACPSTPSGGVAVANAKLLYFAFGTVDNTGSSAPPMAPGTFTVVGSAPPNGSRSVEVGFDPLDATCLRKSHSGGVSGTVTLTSIAPPQGTFDVTFDSGDHVTGSFQAPGCANLKPNSSPTC